MKTLTIRLLSKLFPNIITMFRNFKILSFDYGQWKSVKRHMAVDVKGNPIPWYTYPAIEYLNNFDFTQCSVFEFGSGNSSLYWSTRSKSVVSVEDDQDWFKIVSANKRSNQTLIYRSGEHDYVNALTEQKNCFDIIVIDGNHRFPCTVEAIKKINTDGIILLDNSDRKIEKDCGILLRKNGFIQIDLSGFGPINGYCWTTSIFLKSQKIFLKNYSGPTPIGGLNN